MAQTPEVITMDQEPHHHLALHNDFVKIFDVVVSPGDSIVLHRHDQDTIAIAIGDQIVTVGIPGKPDVHQQNADAQVRLQRSGYMHSTHIDGNTPYHTVAVELMQRQRTGFHNVCTEVLVGQSLNCPEGAMKDSPGWSLQPLLASGETEVFLVRVHPHQAITPDDFPVGGAIVALDPAVARLVFIKSPDKKLQPGDFLWLNRVPDHEYLYQNGSDKEARAVEFVFAGTR
jgi:hypothetical protein